MAMPNLHRKVLVFVLTVSLLLASSSNASAYDNDTHYWLTYYLAVKAGFTPLQAEQIASANVSVDFDDDTEPVTPDFNNLLDAYRFKATFSVVRSKYHALASKSDVNAATKPKVIYWWDPTRPTDAATLAAMKQLVDKRKAQFWVETIAQNKNPGLFLHYLQDTFAHRDFASFFGHAGYRRIDHLSSDRKKAKEMAIATFQYLMAYRSLMMNAGSAREYADPESYWSNKNVDRNVLAAIEETVNALCDVNPSVGYEESAITRKWRTLKEDSKTDYSTPSSYLIPAILETSNSNTAPDSRRAREVIVNRLGLTSKTVPQIWLYDYSRAAVAKPFTSYARLYSNYKLPIESTHDFPAKNEHSNTKRTLMRDDSPTRRKLCMPYALISDTVKSVTACPR